MTPEEKARQTIDALLQQGGWELRIDVTVDMIAAGTDITAPRGSAFHKCGAISQSPAESRDNPLEVLLFLRDVRSRVYFEQMKGRGTRVLTPSEMQAVSGEDARTKDHFVIVDAVGVCDSDTAHAPQPRSALQSPQQRDKTESRPLERLPTVALGENAQAGRIRRSQRRHARLPRQARPRHHRPALRGTRPARRRQKTSPNSPPPCFAGS